MKRYLLVAALAGVGVLVWAGAASAANVLTLCIGAAGNVKVAAPCKPGDTEFKVVSEADYNALNARVTTVEGKVTTLEGKVTALEALLAGVSRPDATTLLLTGLNLQVVNGDGTTDGTNNGLGNIIVGYNADNGDTRTGSHNVVIGDDHTWTISAGLVAGLDNTLTGPYSFVGGGSGNTADHTESFVGGGRFNTAGGAVSFVGGGLGNTAGQQSAFVGGGQGNVAAGASSFVGGGSTNVSGDWAFVGGGLNNTASGQTSFIGGGSFHTAGPGTCGFVIATLFGTC